jgi:hypothetical protein
MVIKRGSKSFLFRGAGQQDEALTITQELGMRPQTERILPRREILRA